MRKFRKFRARPIGVAAMATLAIGMGTVGPLGSGTAAALDHAPNDHAAAAFIDGRTLTVQGSNRSDDVTITADATTVQVAVDGNLQRFGIGDFDAISVSLGNGDDHFTEQAGVLADKHLTVDGGNGDDVIVTGDGKDVVIGGNGDDRVDAGKGSDTVDLGNGNDFFVWNPGEGSDTVDGGHGAGDVMQFNGAAANETMNLSANGPAAVFLRDPGAVRMDMTGIETFDLHALGGSDNVTVGDLAGTDIRQVSVDLSGPAGGGDQSADEVTVNGTDGADHVKVDAHGGQVTVDGLAARTTIAGSETADRLEVRTLDGDDTVAVAPDVSSVIGVSVDLGAGQS